MPNWCGNTVTLKGEKPHRQEFVDKNKGFSMWDTSKKQEYYDLSFHAQIPCPKKHLTSHKKNTSNQGWFAWCNNNWGTKWDCSEPTLTHEENHTSYYFDTAWGSPVEWVRKVSIKFPRVEFHITWAEEGGEGGHYMFHGGDCFFDTRMTEKEWRDYQGYEEEEDEDE